jgi:hypothetical protein
MKNLFIILSFVLIMVGIDAFALNASVNRRDMKMPTQAMLEHQTVATPIVADDDRLLAATTTSGTAVTTVTTFLAQPDVPRNITIIPYGASTADVVASTVTVNGTNFFGSTISEGLAFGAAASTATAGAKAFKTVTSISFPAQGSGGVVWKVGVGDVLGLKRCMARAGDLAWTVFDGTFESTRATCIADVDEVEKNTCDINGTLNGSKNVDFYFVQNWRCLP